MILRITNLNIGYLDDHTKVTVELYEQIGTIEKLKEKLIVSLPGKHEATGEHLNNIIEEELRKNGFNI